MKYHIEEAHAEYTGGGIWLFHGKTKEGFWFLTCDEGYSEILNADPSNFDECLYMEWIDEHLIEELVGSEQESKIFNVELARFLLDDTNNNVFRHGITDEEIIDCLKFWLND